MSKNTVTKNNGQQLQIQTNLAKLFPFEKELRSYDYTNSGYDDVTLQAGTVMGVVKATGEVVPMQSDAADGSELPIGVLAEDYEVEGGETVKVSIGITGTRVREDMLVLAKEDDELTTVVDDRRIFEWLLVAGIVPIGATNATRFDNTL